MMLRFGIEVEFILKFESLFDLMEILKKHQNILIKNKDISGNAHLFKDISINPLHKNRNFENLFHYGLEIKTKKMEFTPENFDKFKSIFEDLSKVVYSNDTCGVHVHCSRKWFSLKDHFALLYEYLKNELYKEFLVIEGNQMSCPMYANLNKTKQYYLNRINKALNNNSKIVIDTTALERKVDLYKVHLEYNTIEFRGLRGHFSKCTNNSILSAIEKYLKIMETLRYDKNIKNVFAWEEE
ncbi:MAG TPA: hypothetical protein P5513_02665 [Candidatus Diapherotrites archaeon]|nr:hypothetical protein [Candidatus Diapherotrites archaeon]